MTNNVVIPFGRRTNGEPPTPPANDEASTTELVPMQSSSTAAAIDNLILFLETNRDSIAGFMGIAIFHPPSDSLPSGFHVFTSPMSQADFGLGVRILDNAANALLIQSPPQ